MLCNFVQQTDGRWKCDRCGFTVSELGQSNCREGKIVPVDRSKKPPCGECLNEKARREGLNR